MARPRSSLLLVAVVATLVAFACGRAWDDYDPRLGSGGEPGTGGDVVGDGGGESVGGGGSGTGGQAGGGGSAPIVCGGVGVATDDFDAGVPNVLFAASSIQPSFANGELQLGIPANSGFGNYGTYGYYDLTGRSIALEVIQVPDDANVFFSLDQTDGYYIDFTFTGGMLLTYRAGAATQVLSSQSYDPVAHRHLRFREEAGTIYFEASPDGGAWEALATGEVGSDLPMNRVAVNMGYYGTPSTVDRLMVVDNLVGDPESHCPVGAVSDDFEAPALSDLWQVDWEDMGCQVATADGRLAFELEAGVAQGTCGVASPRAYDISAGRLTLEVGPGVGDAGIQSWFGVETVGDDDGIVFDVNDGTLYIQRVENGNWESVLASAFTTDAMRYLRLEVTENTVTCQTSADGQRFSTVYATAAYFDPTRIYVWLGGGANASSPLAEATSLGLEELIGTP
ncbi:MAG: hypothetical protein KC731_41535 [Myxococcales bacterium]|nr:hypothetical protein [Myxococcales bacterium]